MVRTAKVARLAEHSRRFLTWDQELTRHTRRTTVSYRWEQSCKLTHFFVIERCIPAVAVSKCIPMALASVDSRGFDTTLS